MWHIRKSALARLVFGPCVGIVIAQDLMGSAPLQALRTKRVSFDVLEKPQENESIYRIIPGKPLIYYLKTNKQKLDSSEQYYFVQTLQKMSLVLHCRLRQQQPGCSVAHCLEQRVETVGVQSAKTQMES